MRLFIAIEPSQDMIRAMTLLQDRLRAAGVTGRYMAPPGLHLTLAYIGEWQEDVSGLLPEIEEDPISFTLSRIGVFPGAKVLWTGPEAAGPLDSLASLVRRRLDSAGVPFDRKPFNPHITLIRKPFVPNDDILAGIRVPGVSMTVRQVCLYRSDHTDAGAKYTVIARGGTEGPV